MATTLSERAYDFIRAKLAKGALAPGDRLSPAKLATEIGISLNPIREALSRLHSEGLVIHEPHRGAFVREPSRQELLDSFSVRKALECEAGVEAAGRITEAELKQLRKLAGQLKDVAEQMGRSRQVEEFLDAYRRWTPIDLAFHKTMLSAAKNPTLTKVVEDVNAMGQSIGYFAWEPVSLRNRAAFAMEAYQAHQEIYETLRRHDRKMAHRAVANHMRLARTCALTRFEWFSRQQLSEKRLAWHAPEAYIRKVMEEIDSAPSSNESSPD
ncbi:MAG: GntR family transcriptional regulator [Pirellulales bacterium]|nr:GntR family transcriptional regulator [Pirellulales bacterium]